MSEWRKTSWLKAVDKVSFDDEWGFGRVRNCYYTIGGLDLNSFYMEDDKGQKVQLAIDTNNPDAIASLFSEKLYYRNRDRYGYNAGNLVSVTVENIEVTFEFVRYAGQRNSYIEKKTIAIGKNKSKRLTYLRHVWICDGLRDTTSLPTVNDLIKPKLRDLNVGDSLFCDKGKCKITKFYPQPNENNLMFQAVLDYEDCDKQPFDVSFGDGVYVLPYGEQPISEYEQFNRCKSEIWLSPYVTKGDHGLNVYWNKIEQAAGYTISLYKKFERPYLQSVYHLKDYIADRNDGFVAIDGLCGGGYIAVVKAENRNGEEIARSRGIEIKDGERCVPQYFKE